MKSIKEIEEMLLQELSNSIDKIRAVTSPPQYYNEILGKTSYLLAVLLESLLKKQDDIWDSRKWIDDSLITNVIMDYCIVEISGVMIWGYEDTTDQWTDPFHFVAEISNRDMKLAKIVFLFCDSNYPGIPYERFRENRSYWDMNIHNWKYEIKSELS